MPSKRKNIANKSQNLLQTISEWCTMDTIQNYPCKTQVNWGRPAPKINEMGGMRK